jgi:WD40 repeat protein
MSSALLYIGKGTLGQSCPSYDDKSLDLSNYTEIFQIGYGFLTTNLSDSTLSWSSTIYVSSQNGFWRFLSNLQDSELFNEDLRIVSWLPNGLMSATILDGQMGIYNRSNGQFILLEDFDERREFVYEDTTWGTNDNIFAAILNQQYIKVWQVENGELLSSFETEVQVPISLSLNADGSLLAVAGSNGDIEFYDPYTGELLSSYTYGTETIISLEWHPRESWLIGINTAGVIFRINYREEASEIITLGYSLISDTSHIEWSLDESLLAIYGNGLSIIPVSALQDRAIAPK